MSDTPQGDGWWQASDSKWYPPQDDSPSEGAAVPAGRRWMLPTVVLVVVALVAAAAAFFVIGGDDEADASVTLESVAEAGPDPFTDSVSITELAEFPDSVVAVADTTLGELEPEGETATLAAPGSTAGLYGGSTSESTCDVESLEAFLTDQDNSAKASAWAGVLGISTDDIPTHLASLTPTVLTIDTRVTNHGFADGSATPRQSVLQAGTAVMIDDLGVPRVRCSCGNPLTEPDGLDLTTVSTNGAQWTGYSASRVVTPVPAGEPVESFTLVDVADGSTFERAPGSTTATWVAVAGDGNADGRRGGTAESGSIHVSSDGAEWEQVLETDATMNAVAHGDGRFVAVGDSAQGGTIVASDNGSTWSDTIDTDVALVDVAFGDGTWVALAEDRTYTSSDGANWTESEPIPFEFSGISAGAIAFGDGEFLVSTYSCGASGCSVTSPLTSSDGTSWAPSDLDLSGTGLRSPSIAHGDEFGLVGFEFGDAPDDAPMVDIPTQPAAALLDGSSVRAVPQATDAPYLRGLSATGDTWYAVGSTGGWLADGPSSVYTSADLAGWARVGEIDARLHDVVVADSAAATAEPTPSTTTTTTTAPEGADVEITEAGFRAGGQEYATASTPASQARAALTAALGEPARATPIGGGVCEPGQYVWGELELIEFNESYWYFTLGSPNVTGDSVTDRVATDTGLRLGDPISEFQAAYPSTRVIETEYGDTAYWADGSGDGKGVMAFASDGSTITSLSGGSDDPTFIGDC